MIMPVLDLGENLLIHAKKIIQMHIENNRADQVNNSNYGPNILTCIS